MSATKTIQLDPAAVEAAVIARHEAINGVGSSPIHSPYGYAREIEVMVPAITAYLAAIEPQVREAVAEVVECASDVEQSRHWGEKRHGRAVADLDDARTALFAVRNRLTTCSA